jgi:energy-coupling factor transport system ATP-binding protein
VAVLREGRLTALGGTREVFGALYEAGHSLEVPPVCALVGRLRALERDLPTCTTLGEAGAALGSRLGEVPSAVAATAFADAEWQSPATHQVARQVSDHSPAEPLPPGPDRTTPPIVEVRDVWFEYAAGVEALRGVSLEVRPGEKLAIVGQNGSGKTTLAKHLNGLLRPNRGAVLVDGEDARRRVIGELARTVGYVFQNPDYQIFAATVAEELAFGPAQLGATEPEVRERVDEALEFFGLGPYRGDPPAALGFGLRRVIGLASVLTMRPRVLVLDEPFTGLDWPSTAASLGWLNDLAGRGHAILLVTHSMRAVAEFADRVVVLAGGKVLADCSPRVLFQSPSVLAAAGLARPQIGELGNRLERFGLQPGCLTVAELAGEYERVRLSLAASPVGRGGDESAR